VKGNIEDMTPEERREFRKQVQRNLVMGQAEPDQLLGYLDEHGADIEALSDLGFKRGVRRIASGERLTAATARKRLELVAEMMAHYMGVLWAQRMQQGLLDECE
jgi:hypothetical protein